MSEDNLMSEDRLTSGETKNVTETTDNYLAPGLAARYSLREL